MRMHLEHTYADADVERVYGLITDPDFVTRKYTEIGGRDVKVERSDSADGGCVLTTTRTVTVDLPGFAKRVMQPTNTAVQTETWGGPAADGSRTCRYRVEVRGMPSSITGTVTLSAAGASTKQDIDADVKVSIPLVGGRLEKFGVQTGESDLSAQFAFTDRALADS